ncbi:MAG: sensor histidine kinase [Ilumatobacter sp.]
MTTRNGAISDLLAEHARGQLDAAIRMEQRASWVATLVPVGLWIWLQRVELLVFAALIVALSALRARAFPAIARGDVNRAMTYFLVGKWTISIVLVFLLPIALPIVVVNLIMPLALASTNLDSRRFAIVSATSVAVALVVAVLGYTTNVFDYEQSVDAWVWQWIAAVVLAVHFVPLSLILWRTNRQQARAYEEAVAANVALQETADELERSRRRLVGAADVERRRIERDLHDGAQQRLVAVLINLRLAARRLDDDGVAEAADELQSSIDELRDLAHGIYPPMLRLRGLSTALTSVARRSPASVTVRADKIPRLAADIEAALYFCCVEAIGNAVKHGGADVEATVTLRLSDRGMTALVADDGPGFEVDQVGDGVGLQNMRDRVGAIGGRAHFRSEPGGGAEIAFEVPSLQLVVVDVTNDRASIELTTASE